MFLVLQEFEVPKISRQSAHEGVKGSALPTGRLCHHEIHLIITSLRGCVDFRPIVLSEVLSK